MEDQLVQNAMAAVYAAAPKAEQDPTRPLFHYRPPAQWMSDVCGAFFYKGWYHIFHQFSPWSDKGGNWSWGHVLINSTYPISYQVGDFDPEAVQFHAKGGKTYVMDYAYGMERLGNDYRGLYGTTTFSDSECRCVLLGWVSGFKTGRGWAGCMSLPRVLSLTADHRLIQTPLPELAELRGRTTGVENLVLQSESRHITGVEGNMLEILAEIKTGDAPTWGLKLCGHENDKEALVIRCASGYLSVGETAIPDLRFGDNGVVKLHIFLDRSVLEVFINDGLQSVTRVVYPGQRKLGIHVFADDGTAIVKSLKGWELKGVW